MNQNVTNESSNFSMEEKLWDEITKSIAGKMPHQLLPLIEEVFHRKYPPKTSVRLLSTEYVTPPKDEAHKFSVILNDITILVQEKDLYHIECQMNMDNEMIIRMIEYDFHVALQHGKTLDSNGSYSLKFPNSVVMYPGINESVPDSLNCTVIFPDGFEHTYAVPVIKMQTYSLADIQQKHLTIFIPFMLIRFRKRLASKTSPIQQNELTRFTSGLIVSLEDEVRLGNITPTEFRDYVELIDFAAERIFHKATQYQKEVLNVTKSILRLPSDEIDELKFTISLNEQKLAEMNSALAEKDSALAEKDSALAEKDSTIAEKDNTIAEKNNTIAEMSNLILELQKSIVELRNQPN